VRSITEVQNETSSEHNRRTVRFAGVGSASNGLGFDFWWSAKGGKTGVSGFSVAYSDADAAALPTTSYAHASSLEANTSDTTTYYPTKAFTT